ncbi:MAG: DUF697 domain-containing protein [Pseudomonadota bacterium]
MPRKDSQDKKIRKTSPDSKLRVKRSRRRIYDALPEEPSSADSSQRGADQTRESTRERKIRWMQARHIVKNYMIGAMGAGLVPIPVIDMAAVSGVQLKMLHSLSIHYDIPFPENRAKAFIASLIGGIGPAALASGAFGMFVKALPGIGTLLGSIKMSLLSGAAAYAVGMVFIQHFESGGTFLDFQPEKVKDYYVRQFQEGRRIAPELPDNGKR